MKALKGVMREHSCVYPATSGSLFLVSKEMFSMVIAKRALYMCMCKRGSIFI